KWDKWAMISSTKMATRFPLQVLVTTIITLFVCATTAAVPSFATPSSDDETESSTSSGTGSGSGMNVSLSEAYERIANGEPGPASANESEPKPPSYRYIWAPVSEFSGCGVD